MFKYATKFNGIILKRIQYYYSKYVNKPSLSHIHIYHQIMYPYITKFNYHISYTQNNHILTYIQTPQTPNVTGGGKRGRGRRGRPRPRQKMAGWVRILGSPLAKARPAKTR